MLFNIFMAYISIIFLKALFLSSCSHKYLKSSSIIFKDIEWMNGLIRNLTSSMSVLIVEHHMDVVMSVCDRLYVLNFGEVISSGSAEDVRRDPAVIAAYLGTGA